MSNKQIQLTRDQLRAIARYELTFRDVISGDDDFNEIEFICPEHYTYTMEDLRCAIAAIKAADPDSAEIGEYWISPILFNSDAFGLDELRWPDEPEQPEGLPHTEGMLISTSDYFDDIWDDLDNAWSDGSGVKLSDDLDFDGVLALIDRYFRDKDKPIEEREFTDWEMRNFIRRFDNNDYAKNATERELALCRRFVEELCAKDDDLALHVKGYACYGGDRLYPCDWYTSRDCVQRLFEKTDDPQCANTLGYIYYYGRCNGGVPEYEQAFRYYGVAAASGLYEGMYKIADMLYHGYGCIKSPNAAQHLYSLVYQDALAAFCKGSDANFADIALRMGNVYAKGIGVAEDPAKAYMYYTEAAYASDLRLKHMDFFGIHTVAASIQKALEETKAQLPKDYFHTHLDLRWTDLFEVLTNGNHQCELTRTVKSNGKVWLKAKRIPTQHEPKPPYMLMTYPSLHICKLVREISLEVCNEKAYWFKDDKAAVRYDYTEYNYAKERFEFYFDRELTAWIQADAFRLYARRVPKPHGPEHRVVSVQFQPNGRVYDYLSDIEDIRPGDTVIVNGYDGETEVTVVEVRVRKESELGLPVEKYKKIVRKVSR